MFLFLILLQLPPSFDTHFNLETMRLDFFHTGTSEKEVIALDRIWNDGPWSGHPNTCLDRLNLGAYRFEIRTLKGALIFSQGFSSIFGEWQNTAQAKTQWGTFHESLRFPWPKEAFKLSIFKRLLDQEFEEIWSHKLDPLNRQIHRLPPQRQSDVVQLINSGPSSKKVDLVLLSDGFKVIEKAKFLNKARNLIHDFFKEEPFRTRKKDFNVWAVFSPSPDSGITKPHQGVYRQSALETQYSSFDSERYILTTANKKVRDAASVVPYDFTVILINENTYGGGGIYNLYSTCPVESEQSSYLFIHEFGHHFAALADEYFTSDVAYELTENKNHIEPWEPNITANPHRENLKWIHLVTPRTPLPTPWNKPAFERLGTEIRVKRGQLRQKHAPESQLDALFKFQSEREMAIFKPSDYFNHVGAFEGGGYYSKGIYRPRMDCIMFSRNPVGFCPVCTEALNKVIDSFCK